MAPFEIDREERLKGALDAAIGAFNARRSALLKQAFDEGGDARVAELETQYDALRRQYFELLTKQLDRHNALYGQLTAAVLEQTTRLEQAIVSLARIASVIQLTASVTSLVGRVITVLAA